MILIYTRTIFFDDNIGGAGKDIWQGNTGLWLSRYGVDKPMGVPARAKFYQEIPVHADITQLAMWQFTSKSTVKGKSAIDGIEGDVDLNLINEEFFPSDTHDTCIQEQELAQQTLVGQQSSSSDL